MALIRLHNFTNNVGSSKNAPLSYSSWSRVLVLTVVSGACFLQSLMLAPLASAYKSGEFPGKGSESAWHKANILFNQGTTLTAAKALSKYKQAISIYPYDANYWVNLGQTYFRLHNHDEAKRCFKWATVLNPEDYDPWVGLANVLYNEGKRNEEKTALMHALMAVYPPPSEVRSQILQDFPDIDREVAKSKTSK